jgi:hypothetical protein
MYTLQKHGPASSHVSFINTFALSLSVTPSIFLQLHKNLESTPVPKRHLPSPQSSPSFIVSVSHMLWLSYIFVRSIQILMTMFTTSQVSKTRDLSSFSWSSPCPLDPIMSSSHIGICGTSKLRVPQDLWSGKINLSLWRKSSRKG